MQELGNVLIWNLSHNKEHRPQIELLMCSSMFIIFYMAKVILERVEKQDRLQRFHWYERRERHQRDMIKKKSAETLIP